jgi:hypothetical protein
MAPRGPGCAFAQVVVGSDTDVGTGWISQPGCPLFQRDCVAVLAGGSRKAPRPCQLRTTALKFGTPGTLTSTHISASVTNADGGRLPWVQAVAREEELPCSVGLRH